jgi:hypothetical protein
MEMVNLTLRELYSSGKSTRYLSDTRLGGPQSQSKEGGEKKKIRAPVGNRIPVVQPTASHCTVAMSFEYPSSFIQIFSDIRFAARMFIVLPLTDVPTVRFSFFGTQIWKTKTNKQTQVIV